MSTSVTVKYYGGESAAVTQNYAGTDVDVKVNDGFIEVYVDQGEGHTRLTIPQHNVLSIEVKEV